MSRRADNAIVLATDAALFPAAVFAADRLAKLNPRSDTDVVLFTSGQAEIAKAASLALPFAVRSISSLPGLPNSGAYLRYAIPHSLGPNYCRIVYVDTDTWIENDRVFRLFDLDMEGKTFAGVRDYIAAYKPDIEELEQTIGRDNRRYLNSGVLVIDPARYRGSNIPGQMAEIIATGGLAPRYLDQTYLNAHLRGDWTELSPAFNMMPSAWGSFVRAVAPPVVVHFAGSNKPWHGPRFGLDHPARTAMEEFFPQSPWRDFLPRFFGLKDAIAASAAPSQRAPSFDRDFPTKDQLLRYLRETRFADVAQGLSQLHLDQLPGSAKPRLSQPTEPV